MCPLRQTLLTDAHHDCTVMGHRGHAQLYHGPWMTFVSHLASAARQQAGDMAFHHWTAIATRTGQVDLMRRALTVQARLGEDVAHLLRTGIGRDRLDCLGDANSEDTPCVERLTQCRVIEAAIPASEWTRGRCSVLTRSRAFWTLSRRGNT